MRNSCCPLPALRWVIVASLMCCPVAQALRSAGVALSMPWTINRSWKVALPAPPPPPVEVDPEFVTPHENESTSISSLCLESTDSPLMSPILAKMSVAIGAPSPCGYAHDSRDCRQHEPSHSALSALVTATRVRRVAAFRRFPVTGHGRHDPTNSAN